MFDIFKKISWFIKENLKIFILFVVSNIIAGSITVFMPKIIGYIINMLAYNNLKINNFIMLLLLLLLLIIIGYISAVTFVYILFKLSLLFEVGYREKYYKHVMKMSGTFFEKFSIGDLMTRINSDLRQVSIATGEGTFFILEGTMFFLLILIGMITSGNFYLTILTVLPLIILIIILIFLGLKILKFSNIAQKKLSKLSDSIFETVDGITVIKAYIKEKDFYNKLVSKIEEGKKEFKKVDNYENMITFFVWFFFGLSEIVALIIGSNMIIEGQITTGELITFILYLGILAWPLIAWSQAVGILKRGESSYDRLKEIMDQEEEIKLLNTHKFIDDFKKIEFINYSFKYPNDNEYVLKDINFYINKGETLGIVGTLGSGKSTIIKQLLMDYPLIEKNSLLLNNCSYNNYNVDSIRSLYGYVPQENIIFSKTIKENLLVAKQNATDYEIMNSLKIADFEKDLRKFPDGINTYCGQNGNMLSGGQRQRLAIARAYLNNPEILIFDDALAALDGETEAKIMKNITKNRIDRTNIIITNRVGVLKKAKQIILLKNGKIIAKGTHEQLLIKSDWYKNECKYQSAI